MVASGHTFEGDTLRDLLRKLASFDRLLAKATETFVGVTTPTLIRGWIDHKTFPRFELLERSGKREYWTTESDLDSSIAARTAAHNRELRVVRGIDSREDWDLRVTEFRESEALHEAAKNVENAGISLETYFATGSKPTFILKQGNHERPVVGLGELNPAVEAAINDLVETKRFKGLGEMNPSQLWDTTMDPARRTLYQVRLEDDVLADKLFTVLMGEQVEPRREYIERHALEARNLDV